MVIDFTALQVAAAGQSPSEDKTEETRGELVAAGKGNSEGNPPPIRVTSPKYGLFVCLFVYVCACCLPVT